MAPKILIVLTSADKFVSKNKEFNGKPTGWYLPELAHPYDVLVGKAELVTASPKGGVAPLDQGSVEAFKEDESSVNFFKNHKDVWEKTLPLSQFVGKAAEFDAVFYPGGHGPLFDLVDDADSIKVIEEFYAAGKIVSAVCHGPIVFANPKTADGKPIVAGRTVTGFTEEEEKLAGLTEAVPFSLEEKLKPAGAKWVQADEPFHSKVVTDGKLITGQNPQSAKDVGEALAKALGI